MPSKEACQKNIKLAISANMRKSALKTALKLKNYLLDTRIGNDVKEDMKKNGLELKIKD
jgi:hypothetical protein